MSALRAKNPISFVFFAYSYMIISTDQVKLCKVLDPTQLDEKLFNQKQQIVIFDGQVVKLIILDI